MAQPRRFPPPWTVKELDACFVVIDSAEQKLAYVYFEEEPGRRSAGKLLSKDEARRIAVNLARATDGTASLALGLAQAVKLLSSSDKTRIKPQVSSSVQTGGVRWRNEVYSLSASALRNRKARPLIASLVFCAVSATAAIATDRGQFANVPPEVREWFEHLQSPDGVPCCSYADGHRTGYDMRQGQYWVPIEGEWYPVPPQAVIKTANPVGEAIVWYVSTYAEVLADPKYRVLCFIPSDGV
jgi:hypothetical protein